MAFFPVHVRKALKVTASPQIWDNQPLCRRSFVAIPEQEPDKTRFDGFGG
jgi:hypothetical protein